MIAISSLRTADCEALVPALVRLTLDAVESGASIGWEAPLDPDDAGRYWDERIARFDADECALFAAFAGDDLVGAVQRERGRFPTTRHRAEVVQLMVLRAWRRRGIARALLDELEDDAFARGIELLALEVPLGEAVDALCRACGYERSGVIPYALKHTDGAFADTTVYCKLLD